MTAKFQPELIVIRRLPVRSVRAPQTLVLPALIALVVAPAVLIAAMLEIDAEFDRGRELRAAVNHSYEERLQLQTVFSLIQDAETGQRGYIITGQRAFLQPYETAVAQLDEEFKALETLHRDRPSDRYAAGRDDLQSVRRLQDLMSEKVANLRASIALRDTAGREAAVELVSSGRGKELMDQVRLQVSQMTATEARALEQRVAADARRTQRSKQQILGMFAALALSLLGAFAIMFVQARARQQLLGRVQAGAERQLAIFDSAQDGLVTFNRSGTIETVNHAAETMFGFQREELSRRDVGLLLELPESGDVFLQRLARDHDLREGLIGEFTGRKKEGGTFPIEVSLGEFESGGEVFIIASIRDITERRRIEKLKSEFVSTVSHELRTPLTSIAGSLGLLTGGAAGALPERAARLLGIAHSNCQRLVRLINDILDIEKIESGQMTFAMAPLDLDRVMRRAIEGMNGLADELGVTFAYQGLDQPPMVSGDGDRLTQVAANLLSNAAKFSPRGGEIEVTLSQTAEGRLRLSVRDHGPGVPEAFQARLFSKFAQADASDTRQKGGTGLGLAISREIVERHGGRLWHEPAPGQGAIFLAELPVVAAPTAVAPRGPRILVCEDDPDAATVICAILHSEGFAGETVGTLAEAERALMEKGGYVALLLDMGLPDGNGLDLLQRLRQRPETRDLPVLIVSGDGGDGVQALDVIDWLQKPVDVARLQAGLAAALRGRGDRPLVLHVEDDPDVRQIVGDALSAQCEVVAADSVAAARLLLQKMRPRLAILDIALGDGSGLELLPLLRPLGEEPVPVIVFSAQSLEGNQLANSVDSVLTKSRSSLSDLANQVRRLAASGARQETSE